jgi:YD repeat-containing protein
MRQIVLFVSVLVLFLVCVVNGAEPNFVRSTVYNVNDVSGVIPPVPQNNVISTDYTDGLGRTIQSKLQLNQLINGVKKARVVSSFFDAAGRPYLTTKSYIDKGINPIGLFTPGDFNEINATLNNTDNYDGFKVSGSAYAYSESQYYDDPLGRVKRAGAPGDDYRLGSPHFTSSWTFGVTINTSELTYNFTTVLISGGTPVNVQVKLLNGFVSGIDALSSGATVSQILDGFYNYLLTTPISNCSHFLTVAKDPDNKLTQELKDLFSRTVSTKAGLDGNPIIAGYDFDILGNVLAEHAPLGKDPITNLQTTLLISDSKYEYNTLGQLIRKESPDLFVEEMTYDNAGNIASKIVHGMNAKYDMFTITYNYDYDDMSRLKTIRTPDVFYGTVELVRYFYDNTDEFFTKAKEYGVATEQFTNLENTQGKLVAEIAYNRPAGRRFYFGGQPELVVDVYSYDDEGRVKTKYKIIPGLPLQTIVYTYDDHGKMKTEEFKCGSTVSKKYYKYDADGNLNAIAHGDEANDVITYKHDLLGKFDTTYFSQISTGNMLRRTYNIRGWMDTSSFNGANSFSQAIDYINDNPSGTNNSQKTFNGNIRNSSIIYSPSAGASIFFKQGYIYDDVNRLESLTTDDNSGSDDVAFRGHYSYDNAGRFTLKHEGSSDNDDYQYYKYGGHATCRLKQAKSTGNKIYIYDYKGNMIIDQSKNMYISYDWRNLPIRFDFYRSLPVGPTDVSKISPDHYGTMIINDNSYPSREPTNYVDYIDWLRENGQIELLSSVQMYYDAAGKRVLKVER